MATREVSLDALPAGKIDALKKLYGNVPPGRFLHGQHGITHFRLEEPNNAGKQRARIAVLSHGLGTSTKIYDGAICASLLAAGFRVLRYDFLGHGWSHSFDRFLQYEKDMFLSSLNELLDHVLEPGEPIDLWVGHSTGGIVGVLAASSKKHPIRELALISPAFWANKPFIAVLADKLHPFMHNLVKKIGPLKVLPQNAYLENNDIAFGKKGKEYMFPEKYEQAKQDIKNMFELNPQAVEAIFGIASFFLREDLIVHWRTTLKEVVQMKGDDAPRICLLWGKYDVVVPFAASKEVLSWGSPGRVSMVALEAGHESPAEVPEDLAREILKFVQVPSRM